MHELEDKLFAGSTECRSSVIGILPRHVHRLAVVRLEVIGRDKIQMTDDRSPTTTTTQNEQRATQLQTVHLRSSLLINNPLLQLDK